MLFRITIINKNNINTFLLLIYQVPINNLNLFPLNINHLLISQHILSLHISSLLNMFKSNTHLLFIMLQVLKMLFMRVVLIFMKFINRVIIKNLPMFLLQNHMMFLLSKNMMFPSFNRLLQLQINIINRKLNIDFYFQC